MAHPEQCPAMSTEPSGDKARASGDATVGMPIALIARGEQGRPEGHEHGGHRSGPRNQDAPEINAGRGRMFPDELECSHI